MSDPSRRSPRVLIAAFEGWSDAGAATTTVLQHLAELVDAEIAHVISAEGYVDFQVHRPKISFDEQGGRVIDWPDTRLYRTPAAAGPGADALGTAGLVAIEPPPAEAADPAASGLRRVDGSPIADLFLLAGVEPARDWRGYADEIIEIVDVWSIETVVLLGSMYSDAPHSRPIITSVSSENAERRAATDAVRSTYEGPAGIGSILELAFAEADIDAVSIWAQVPHYVHSAPSPKAALAIIDKLEELLDIVIPRGDLFEEAAEWEENINRIAAADEDMSHYIRRLEESRDADLAAEASGDALELELQKFLEQRRRAGDGDAPAD